MISNFFQLQKYLEGDLNPDKLVIHKQIGRGNSDVYLAEFNQQKIALKQTEIKSDYQYHNFLKEVSMLKTLSEGSDTVVKYEGYFVTAEKEKTYSTRRYGYMLMEQAQMSLSELIKSNISQRTKVSMPHINSIVSTLLNGFAYLQSLNIAHCDIKPENVLVIDATKMRVKICDVGSCKIIDHQAQDESTIKGTLAFLAPELIKIEAQKITAINPFRSDVYSFGLVVLYLVTGKKFSSQERKEIKEEVYFEVISQWIKQASEVLCEQSQIVQILKKALEEDQYKRPLFKEIKVLFDSLNRKKKILKDNKIRKMKRSETQMEPPVENNNKKQEQKGYHSKLPKIKGSNSSTLISFHSRQRLTGKISINSSKPQLDKKSSQKSKRSSDKSKSKVSPLQKTTMYSTFSIDKSKASFRSEGKKIIHVTNENFNMIPYENLHKDQITFVLYVPYVEFQMAQNVVIKKECTVQVFDQLSTLKSANSLYLEYEGVQIYGTDQNTPTIPNFQSVFINLENSSIEGGYNNLLRCLCPISLKNLNLQLTGSEIGYKQVKMQLERLKNKDLSKLDLCWDHAFLNAEQFTEINEKISKLPLKKLILSLSSAFLKPTQKSRWPLPLKCKTLYLNFSNNFLSEVIGNLSLSLTSLTELKELYLNMQNNCLTDTDIKILIKSLMNSANLQKAILNFSWNLISKGNYCFQQLKHLNKMSSLELRVSKCGISFDQFWQIFLHLIKLFNFNLQILKITYDRKITKGMLMKELSNKVNDQFSQGLKLDIIGYDYSFFMIYVKKKSQVPQKSIRIRIKQNSGKNSINKPVSNKNIETSTNMSSNKTIPYTSMNLNRKKEQKDQYSTIQMKQTHSIKNIPNCDKTCEALFSTYPTYECYICLGCIEGQQTSKFQHFCRACIKNCEHKGHPIVRTYEKKVCNCPYNHKCHFKIENNDFICAEKLGIHYKKQYQCQKCHPNQSLCQGCILQCQEGHPEWVQKKSSAQFRCFNYSCQNQQTKLT